MPMPRKTTAKLPSTFSGCHPTNHTRGRVCYRKSQARRLCYFLFPFVGFDGGEDFFCTFHGGKAILSGYFGAAGFVGYGGQK
jgi:hypothetical protein